MVDTFTISRTTLRRILTNAGLTESNISSIMSQIEKAHRHMNIISFGITIEKFGINKESIIKVFRSIGVDDITIHDIINMMDEERINAEAGKTYEISLDLS
jgi:5-bromo-4-chloroindolyl phosphate hydrolysis protein